MPASTDPSTFEEDIKFRGLHPMIARRLQMWRLENFEISPLPATGDVHLFDCVAAHRPFRPPADRGRRGARRDAGARRARQRHRAARGGARAGRLPRCAPRRAQRSPRCRQPWNGTGSCSTCGRSSTCRPRPSTRWPGGSPPSPRAWAWSRWWSAGAWRRAVPTRSKRSCASGTNRAAVSRCVSPSRPPRRCNRSTTTPASSSRCAAAG